MGTDDLGDWQADLATLASRPATERARILMQLGWSRAGDATPGIEAFLNDEEGLVRVAAAQARWQTAQDVSELDRLVGILADVLDEGDEELALMAGTALVSMGDSAVAALVRCFEARGSQSALVVRVVGEIGGESALAFIRAETDSFHDDVAREARAAIKALGGEEAFDG